MKPAPPGPLRNATAFMYNDDFWSNETGHYCVISGNNSHVLALHWKDNRSNMNLRLPVSVPDGFGPIGAFMSDEMGAVCCLDGEGRAPDLCEPGPRRRVE